MEPAIAEPREEQDISTTSLPPLGEATQQLALSKSYERDTNETSLTTQDSTKTNFKLDGLMSEIEKGKYGIWLQIKKHVKKSVVDTYITFAEVDDKKWCSTTGK